jgi:hypothetical protein
LGDAFSFCTNQRLLAGFDSLSETCGARPQKRSEKELPIPDESGRYFGVCAVSGSFAVNL